MKYLILVVSMLISTISYAQWDFSNIPLPVSNLKDEKSLVCLNHKHLITTMVRDRVLRDELISNVDCDRVFQEHTLSLTKIREERRNNSPEVLRQKGFVVCERKGDVVACK
jgi:hypothetical protein